LRAKHQEENGKYFGIDGNSGEIVNMHEANVWEPLAVRL
jgi:chaperonin GroEL (HSP60 family)